MSDTGAVFEAFYAKLVLRDVFAKIVPGAIVLGAVGYPWLKKIVIDTPPNSFWMGLLVFSVFMGAAWLAGFALQAFGEVTGLLRYYPRCFEKENWREILKTNLTDLSGPQNSGNTNRNLSDANYLEFLDEFHRAKMKPEQAQQAERFVIIKEACGNGYLAIGVALLILGVQWLIHKCQWNAEWVVPLLVIIGLLYFLRKMHLIHVDRDFRYKVKAMRDGAEQRVNSSNNSVEEEEPLLKS